MGDVVRFARPDPERDAYSAEVRQLCALARCSEWADEYIIARRPIEDVRGDCLAVALGRRLPQDITRRWARLQGRAGSQRRVLPKQFGLYS